MQPQQRQVFLHHQGHQRRPLPPVSVTGDVRLLPRVSLSFHTQVSFAPLQTCELSAVIGDASLSLCLRAHYTA